MSFFKEQPEDRFYCMYIDRWYHCPHKGTIQRVGGQEILLVDGIGFKSFLCHDEPKCVVDYFGYSHWPEILYFRKLIR